MPVGYGGDDGGQPSSSANHASCLPQMIPRHAHTKSAISGTTSPHPLSCARPANGTVEARRCRYRGLSTASGARCIPTAHHQLDTPRSSLGDQLPVTTGHRRYWRRWGTRMVGVRWRLPLSGFSFTRDNYDADMGHVDAVTPQRPPRARYRRWHTATRARGPIACGCDRFTCDRRASVL